MTSERQPSVRALADREERESPQQHERRPRERRREVRPERRGGWPGAPTIRAKPSRRSADDVTAWMAPVAVSTETSAFALAVGRLRITANVSTANSTHEPGEAAERDAPGRRVQERRERQHREQLPALADDAGQLHEDRRLLLGEPRRDHPQHAREDRPHRPRRPACGRRSQMPTSGANAMTSWPIGHEDHARPR